MGRAKCKKKAMERAKCKKNATGQFVVSRIWERQPTGWNHKTTTSSTCFFLCVFVCVWICILLCFWSNDQDSTTCPIPSNFNIPTQKHHRCMTDIYFFSSLWERKERHPLKNGSPYKSVVLAGPAYRRSWNWPAEKKGKWKLHFSSCFLFTIVFWGCFFLFMLYF